MTIRVRDSKGPAYGDRIRDSPTDDTPILSTKRWVPSLEVGAAVTEFGNSKENRVGIVGTDIPKAETPMPDVN